MYEMHWRVIAPTHAGQSAYRAPTVHEGTSGRPRFDIPRNMLACLLEIRFTVPQIANILGVSARTLRRRMSDYILSVRDYILSVRDFYSLMTN